MKSATLTLLHAAQAAFGIYNLYLASVSIRNLQQYEETSKKAAKYSNTAEHQLHKTRTTQASAAIALLLSLFSSVYLIFGSAGAKTRLAVVSLNVLALGAAWHHVGEFWRGKARIPVPGVGDYNEATKNTQEVRLNLAYLTASWVGAAVLSLIF